MPAVTKGVGVPMRLGVPVELYPGEWLHSAISRWAWQIFGVSRAALLDAFGFATVPHSAIVSMGTRLLPEMAANIAFATGIGENRLRGATMEVLADQLIYLNNMGEGRVSSVVSKEGPWSWNVGTRYCPDCLRERPGVFYVRWRSPWWFACLRHHRLLFDACSECQGEVAEMRGRNTDLFDPSTCRANVAPNDAKRRTPCRAPLQEAWEFSRLSDASPPLLAQQLIALRMRTASTRDFVRLLQSAGTAIRGAKDFDLMALLSGLDARELEGLFDDEAHVGTSAPKSAYAMAGLAGSALVLSRINETIAGPIIRRTTFARPPGFVPRGAGHGPGSPAELLSRWPDAPPPLRARILRAHDQDLTISQRILGGTTVDPKTLKAHGPLGGLEGGRGDVVPQHLWPAWTSRLDVGGAVSGSMLARALSYALRLCGTWQLRTTGEADHALARVIRPNMLGTPKQTRAILAGITELALTIDEHPGPIDYNSRLRLPASGLLPLDHWILVADSIGADPGAERRHRNARRYLWLRLSAAGTDRLPTELRPGRTGADAAEYTDFCTRMTAELQSALDAYAEAFLRHHGRREPVTWTPSPAVDLDWPGTELLDFDIGRLHELLRDGVVTHRRLAAELGVSARRIVRAIDWSPPVQGRAVDKVDWTAVLPPLISTTRHESRRRDGWAWFHPRIDLDVLTDVGPVANWSGTKEFASAPTRGVRPSNS